MADQVPPDELTTTENAAAVEIPLKMRVHALAKMLGVTSKQVLAELAALGEQVKTAQSSVERTVALRVQAALAGDQPDAKSAAPAEETRASEAAKSSFTAPLFLPPESAATVARPKKSASARKTAQLTFAEPGSAVAEPAASASAEKPEAATATESKSVAEVARAADPQAKDPIAEDSSAEDSSTEHSSTEDSSAEHSDADDSDSDTDGAPSRRRRRGRRGRGRGRGEQSSEDGSDDDSSQDSGDDDDVATDTQQSSDGNADMEDSKAAHAASEQTAGQQDTAETEGENGKESAEDGEESAPRSGRRRSRRSSRSSGAAGPETTALDDAEAAGATEDAARSDEESDDSDDKDSTDSQGDDDANGSSTRRRRRRRRRSTGGDDSGESTQDDPPNTVVHEREPRNKRTPRDEVQGISGSTRLEAKRQRRRDGREAGRRRPPILSESEFLARREAVDRVMVVREKSDGHGVVTQVGVLEDKVLVEHFVTSAATPSIVGNVYIGRVQNVLPSMEAAFIDIGRGRNGVLYAGEVDWASAGLGGSSRKIEQALKPGDQVLVQVSKDPVGHKGARLTTQISMAGRFLVYVPGGSSTGISRKLPDTERARLKAILREIVPANAGVIIRTASEGVSEDELARDVERLQNLWDSIHKLAEDEKASKSNGPKALYEEPDLLVKVVRDLFNEDFAKLVIDGDQAWETITNYIGRVAPDLMERVQRYENHGGKVDAFSAHRIDEQLVKALDRKVWLPSGGTLVIDRTEAMTVVDVNTGKYTGSGGNLEETVTRNNLEAAEEVVRQMRLRDIGGMIVVDFIDMVLEANRDLVLRRLTEALGRDRTRHQVSEVTSLGLVQMTRKRMGTGLIEAFSTTCDHCHGRGLMIHSDPIVADTDADSGRSGKGEPNARRGRRNKGAEAPATEQASPAQSPAEHPMFKTMGQHEQDEAESAAKAVSDGATAESASPVPDSEASDSGATEQVRPSRRERGRRGQRSAGSTASQPEAAQESDAENSGSSQSDAGADAKSVAKLDAMAKIEAAVTRSAGPRKRSQQAPAGDRRGSSRPADRPAAQVAEPVAQVAEPAAQVAVPVGQPEPDVARATDSERPASADKRSEGAPTPAATTGPPARRRSRRASRPTSAPVEHAQPEVDEIRSEIIVPAAQPAAQVSAAEVSPAAGETSSESKTQAETPVRRPRRRAAGRQAGPPPAP